MIYREFVVTNMHEQTVYIMKKKIQIYAHCKQCHFYFLSKAATSLKKKTKKKKLSAYEYKKRNEQNVQCTSILIASRRTFKLL